MEWLTALQHRNMILYWFGWCCLAGAIVCIFAARNSSLQVNAINAFIKPIKFFISVWIFSWTMGWILGELKPQDKIIAYSIMVVLVMLFELSVITWQAANGRRSHFNTSTPLYANLFTWMGIAISILTVWTFVMGLDFWRASAGIIEAGYLWGIRMGIILFTIFAFEGAVMGAKLRHSIGGADGSPGIPFINWSKQYGDLRIAHFFGMHALQLLPLLGYFVFKKPAAIISFSAAYAAVVSYLLLQAMRGIPLLKQ
jgi:hypothetical protein